MLQKTNQVDFLNHLRNLIDANNSRLAKTVNQEMTLLYWNIGKTIQTEILKFERSEYGEQIINKIGFDLQLKYGRGFGSRVLRRSIHFFSYFPDYEIVSTLSTQLTWSHFEIGGPQ